MKYNKYHVFRSNISHPEPDLSSALLECHVKRWDHSLKNFFSTSVPVSIVGRVSMNILKPFGFLRWKSILSWYPVTAQKLSLKLL